MEDHKPSAVQAGTCMTGRRGDLLIPLAAVQENPSVSRAPLDHPFDLAGCFAPDYATARGRFLAAAMAAGARMHAYVNPLRGPVGEELATDTAWFGPGDAPRVLVMQAGTHGVEGFTGSGAMLDFLAIGGTRALPPGFAVLMIHAINPHGFAWLRRVTEENVDLNRNFVDFAGTLPENPGHDELADALVPREITGPVFEAAEAKIAAYRAAHGEKAFQIARGGGQYRHEKSMFFGGKGPTWARRTLEAIVADNTLAMRTHSAVVDYHTGLGPFGYGEPICGHDPGDPGLERSLAWYGDSVTSPAGGTSSSVVKNGLNEQGWARLLGGRLTFVSLEYGTYSPERGRRALREDHWLHAYTNVDWQAPETRRIKAQLRKQFFPDSDDWKEMVLFRSRQILRQALAGLATT
jgi:hypothetical protein